MKDMQHKVNIYNLKDIDQNSCSDEKLKGSEVIQK